MFEDYCFHEYQNFGNPKNVKIRKDARRQMMEIRVTNLKNHRYEINILLKTSNGRLVNFRNQETTNP